MLTSVELPFFKYLSSHQATIKKEEEEKKTERIGCMAMVPASPLVPDLQPAQIWPCRYTKAVEALGFLKTIDHVEVTNITRHQSENHLVIEVYLVRTENRIPTNRASTHSRLSIESSTRRLSIESYCTATSLDDQQVQQHQPDYRLKISVKEFEKLQYNVWVHAQQPLPQGESCCYCNDILGFINEQNYQSRFLDRIWTSKTRRRAAATEYINRMLMLAVGRPGDGQRSTKCEGFDHIPKRLVQFLKKRSVIDQLN